MAVDEWMPRGMCGPWERWQMLLYGGSHIMITAAYAAMGLTLWHFRTSAHVRELRPSERRKLAHVFAAFILTCAIGHTEGFLSFFSARYDLYAWWHALTALVAWWAAATVYEYKARVLTGI